MLKSCLFTVGRRHSLQVPFFILLIKKRWTVLIYSSLCQSASDSSTFISDTPPTTTVDILPRHTHTHMPSSRQHNSVTNCPSLTSVTVMLKQWNDMKKANSTTKWSSMVTAVLILSGGGSEGSREDTSSLYSSVRAHDDVMFYQHLSTFVITPTRSPIHQ